MCTVSKSKAPAPAPSIIDGAAAARDEMALRRKRSGLAKVNASGMRLGDLGQPSLAVKALGGG